MKRFQECNWLVKLWRYRHYFYIPFRFFWWRWFVDGKMTSKEYWSLLVGSAQCDMNWTYSHEEVMEEFKKYKDNKINKDD